MRQSFGAGSTSDRELAFQQSVQSWHKWVGYFSRCPEMCLCKNQVQIPCPACSQHRYDWIHWETHHIFFMVPRRRSGWPWNSTGEGVRDSLETGSCRTCQ